MEAKSEGCNTCHVKTDAPTMHVSPAVRLGCTDCHGGNASVRGKPELPRDHPDYTAARDAAHAVWNFVTKSVYNEYGRRGASNTPPPLVVT